MRGIDKECDAEAVRVVSSMPKWQAGTQNGEAVRCRFTVPFIFKLNENEKFRASRFTPACILTSLRDYSFK